MTASDMFRLLKAHAGTALRVVRSSEMLRAMPIALMRFDSHRHHNQGEQAEAYSAASLGLCTAERFSKALAQCPGLRPRSLRRRTPVIHIRDRQILRKYLLQDTSHPIQLADAGTMTWIPMIILILFVLFPKGGW